MIDSNTKGLIRSLIYPVQFEKDPKDGIDRVILMIQDKTGGVSQEQYIAAIKSALISTEELHTLIPQPHSNLTVRNYLRELEAKLTVNSDYRQ